MRGDRPLILVTGPDKRLRFGWWAARFMLRLAGLQAHYLTPQRDTIPAAVRGVLIGGGDDIDPVHYGITGDAGAVYDAARDAMEISVLRAALHCGVPVFGICRGAQLLNVVLGGTLHADLRPHRQRTPNRNSLFPVKSAFLRKGSRLQKALGKSTLRVNSLHHQAVDRAGEGLQVVAQDADGFVQAIEGSGPAMLLGVQWHPEYLPYIRSQRRLFGWFAQAVVKSSATLECIGSVGRS